MIRMVSDAASILEAYLAQHPDDVQRLESLNAFLARTPAERQTRRDNFDGHLTASGIVVDRSWSGILLVRHAALDCWLQPGGHIEAIDASLSAAALREVIEETGMPADALALIGAPAAMPIDIDSHRIPARPTRGEPAHEHHDFRYLFVADDVPVQANTPEITGIRWLSFFEAAASTDLSRPLGRIGARA